MTRASHRRDEGVSSIVAAVLVFALISTATALWAAVELPEWEADRERAHRDATLAELGGLQQDLEALSVSGGTGPVGRSVELAPTPIALVGGTTTGSLDIVAGSRFQAEFGTGALQTRDGAFVGSPTEDVTASHGGIAAVHAHTVHLSTSGLAANDEASVRWTWTDGTDSLTLDLVHTGSNGGQQCSNQELRLEWSGPSGTGRDVLLCGASILDDHRVDLLPAGSAQRAALGALDTPLSVSGSTFTVGGGVTVTAVQGLSWTDDAGRARATGGAGALQDIDRESAALRFRPSYQEYAPEDLVWQLGAVASVQEASSGMARAPALSIDTSGSQGFVDWTIVLLAGDDGVEGDGAAQVSLTHVGTSERVYTANDAVLTVTGQGAAWRSHLKSELDLHAVPDADAKVGGTGDEAILTLSTGTIVSEWTVRLRIIEATVTLS